MLFFFNILCEKTPVNTKLSKQAAINTRWSDFLKGFTNLSIDFLAEIYWVMTFIVDGCGTVEPFANHGFPNMCFKVHLYTTKYEIIIDTPSLPQKALESS